MGEQAEFVEFLKSKKLANKTIITIKNNSNMFFQFLHEKSKGKIELMKFTFPSLTRAGVRRYEKERKKRLKNKDKRLSGEDYISEDDFKLIYNYCIKTTPSDDEERYRKIAPYVFMCYHYGLRRSEVMALKPECLKNEYLIITEQLKKVGEYGELKHGAEERRIPHTFTEKKLTIVAGMIKLISEIEMHPTTYTKRFSEVMEALNKKYTIHNIRNTYISNCFDPKYGLSLTDVMFFAGHKSVRTTEGYIRNRKQWEAEQTLDLGEYLDDFNLDEAV